MKLPRRIAQECSTARACRNLGILLLLGTWSFSAAEANESLLSGPEEVALFKPFEESRRVDFADVLANPDDIQLNFLWAQTQMADGRLTGAAATLERILLIQPELQRVRLMYALVLFRLGSLQEAESEFRLLRSQQRSAAMRKEIDAYLKKTRKKRAA